MKNSKETRGFSNFGFSTILLSFVMICVVTFSALSLVTANSDRKLSRKISEKTVSYYAAEERAADKVAALEKLLIDCYSKASGEKAYYELLTKTLPQYGELSITEEGYVFSFQETISQEHFFSVKLSLFFPAKDEDTFYRLLEWKSFYSKSAPEDDTLNLIQ